MRHRGASISCGVPLELSHPASAFPIGWDDMPALHLTAPAALPPRCVSTGSAPDAPKGAGDLPSRVSIAICRLHRNPELQFQGRPLF
eukprot:scaffold43233_cov43-Phaeocystis_antarctica.AAC.2